MNCQNIRENVELHVLGELDGPTAQAVRDHLAICPGCARLEQDTAATVDSLRAAVPATQATPLFMQRLNMIAAGERIGGGRRVLVWLAPLAAAMLLAVTGWAIVQFLPGQAGPDDQVAVKQPAPEPPVVEVWQRTGALPTPAAADDAVIVRGQFIYLLVNDSGVTRAAALDAGSDGRLHWMSPIACSGQLAADDQRLFCLAPGEQGRLDLAAFRLSDGKLLWRLPQDHRERLRQPVRPLVLPDNRVCWATNSSIIMVDARSGGTIWSRSLIEEGPLSRPQMLGERLYVATGQGMVALSAYTGHPVERVAWPEKPAGFMRPLLEVAGDKLIASISTRGAASLVMCLTPGQAAPGWSVATESAFHLLATGQRVYVRSQNVLALDLADGKVVWQQSAKGCSPITAEADLLYYVDIAADGGLVALDAATGHVAWQLSGLRSCDAFVTDKGVGYVKTQDGILRALAMCKL